MKMGWLVQASPTDLVGLFTGRQERSATGNRTPRPRRDGVPNDTQVPTEHRRAAAGRPLLEEVGDNKRAAAADCWRWHYRRSRPRQHRRGYPRQRRNHSSLHSQSPAQ